ncbi:hypothetical protein BJ986_002216 [Phycicoccus badiiscoriae]|uniref:DUF2505 domain-containing protein n=1 Tax=Pedococcus badiiscoriae TaxID=642776 RepID=A0A852WG39_9MICO|nr:DUF2505 domain-containing protein [Pedococcus badiiscoriae]NYG07729.1 hypothetical protein [Pedococcus badiiscoriae]
MKIAKSIEYAATPQEVFTVLSDVKFQEAKCAATAAIKHTAKVESSGDHTVITTERILPSDGLPDFAKSMVGETLKVTETQDWGPASSDGSRRGTVEMAVAGAPIALQGTLSLAPGGSGTVEQLDAELKARVPLIGGKIEKAAAPPIEEAIDIEATTAQEWLAR